jgi:hypothetical protein
MGFCVVGGVESSGVELDAQLFTQSFDESLVAVALFASEVEVAVGCHYVIAQLMEYEQQAHGVGTSAYCSHNLLFFAEQVVLADEISYFFRKVRHGIVDLSCREFKVSQFF